ncbi:MAG: metalloregulator ArsR/SmtB family transcription factor [Actinomycetota bacterium]
MSLSNKSVNRSEEHTDVSSEEHLDRVFHALANRTRRQMLIRLAEQPATIGELAEPFDMTLPGASKHLRVLERAGLARREIEGRIHRCSYRGEPLFSAQTWLAENQRFWEGQLDQLARHVTAEKAP